MGGGPNSFAIFDAWVADIAGLLFDLGFLMLVSTDLSFDSRVDEVATLDVPF